MTNQTYDMHRMINEYKRTMVSKILSCKIPFEVLAVIDRKIMLIRQKTDNKQLIFQFIDDSLYQLRHINEAEINADQFSKIRAAIARLQSLQIQYKGRRS